MHDLRREGIRGRRLPFLVVSVIAAFAGWIYAVGDPATRPALYRETIFAGNAYGRLPLSFEENRGQTDPRVKFLARGSGYALFLTPTEAVLKLRRRDCHIAHLSAVRIGLKDANPTPRNRRHR